MKGLSPSDGPFTEQDGTVRYYFDPGVSVAKFQDGLLVKTPERVLEIKGSPEFQTVLRDGLNETGISFPQALNEEHDLLVTYLKAEGVLVEERKEQDALIAAINFGGPLSPQKAVFLSGDSLILVPLRQQFVEIGGEIGEREDADIWVFASATNNEEEILAFNRQLIEARKTGLAIVASGNEFRVGPAIDPHLTACEDCLRHRINAASRNPDQISSFGNVSWGARPSAATIQAATAFGLAQIAQLAFGSENAAYNRFYVGNVLISAFKEHQILKIPRCPSCGRPVEGEGHV